MKAYLAAQPSIRRENRAPDAPFPFTWRPALAGWKWLNFVPKRLESDPDRSVAWHRGRYLVEAAAHCGECHTPRTLTGGLNTTLSFAGSLEGPEGQLAPNITPDPETGIGTWTERDFITRFKGFEGVRAPAAGIGFQTQHAWTEYAKMTESDLADIYAYLMAQPAVRQRVDPVMGIME